MATKLPGKCNTEADPRPDLCECCRGYPAPAGHDDDEYPAYCHPCESHNRHGAPCPYLVDYPYYWRVRTRLGARKGWPCRVAVRGGRNSALVEFPDGYRAVTSRNYLRRRAVSDGRG